MLTVWSKATDVTKYRTYFLFLSAENRKENVLLAPESWHTHHTHTPVRRHTFLVSPESTRSIHTSLFIG